jgi:hypothetical protein
MPAVRDVARKAGLSLEIADTRDSDTGYDEAFEAIARTQCQALLVMSSPIFARDCERLPAIYADALHVREGGLIAYGTTARELDPESA